MRGAASRRPGGRGLGASAALLRARAAHRAAICAGVAPGEPVLTTIANAPADLAALLGVWLAGGVAVPVPGDAGAFASDAIRQATARASRVDAGALERIADAPPAGRATAARRRPRHLHLGQHGQAQGRRHRPRRGWPASSPCSTGSCAWADGPHRRAAAPHLHLRHLGEPAGGAQRRPPGAGSKVHARERWRSCSRAAPPCWRRCRPCCGACWRRAAPSPRRRCARS